MTIDWQKLNTDDRWCGWGYIGGRASLDSEGLTVADAVVEHYVTLFDWDYETLFLWANSKAGRWFADLASGEWTVDGLIDASVRLFGRDFIKTVAGK